MLPTEAVSDWIYWIKQVMFEAYSYGWFKQNELEIDPVKNTNSLS